MNNIQISNSIFSLGLNLKELAIYTYLMSVHSSYKKVSMATIASACGLKTVEAVSRNISSLLRKGLITSIISTTKADGLCGSNMYVIKELPLDDGFFFFPRPLFKMGLSYKELCVLLFQYKAYSPDRGISWNSYSDIAKALKMKRSEVISTVNTLVQKKLLRKRLFRSQSNRNVYSDNHYTVIWFNHSAIMKRIKRRRACPLHIGKPQKEFFLHYHNTSFFHKCQAKIMKKIKNRTTPIPDNVFAVIQSGSIQDFARFIQSLNSNELSYNFFSTRGGV